MSVSMEDLKMQEQIRLVRSADIIIAFHGAGLTHVLWMRQGTALIELTGGEYSSRNMYSYFAHYVDIDYRLVIGSLAVSLAPLF